MSSLAAGFNKRISQALRPRTLQAYTNKFRFYLAFVVKVNPGPVDSFPAISLFMEYLAQQGLRVETLTNYLTVLKHFFLVYQWDDSVLDNRLLKLAVRSVAHNAPLTFRVKGIFSVNQLRQLMRALSGIPNERVYKAVMLMGFFGFYRLSSLVPPSKAAFSPSRFPTHGDVIWGAPSAHIVTKCTKSMQTSGHSQIVQLPALREELICPVAALRGLVSVRPHHRDLPLFTISQGDSTQILTATKVRLILRQAVSKLGLHPSEFGFHAFRRSGACWAFDHNIDLDYIKTHGGWKSDAIWRYLVKTPAAASAVAKTFQSILN